MSDIRQELISKLFSSGSSENLIVHVKTYQDIQSFGHSKEAKGTPRYLCLTQKKNIIRLLKVKRNHNGSFSISKTWSLDDIKQIQIIDTHQFSLTLNKRYVWAVERSRDKMIFLAFLIDSCKRSASHMPKLVNIDESRIIRYLADPSAPMVGSHKLAVPGNDSDGFLERPQSLLSSTSPRETSFPPSPTTSSGYNYNSLSMSGRSVRSSVASEKPQYKRTSYDEKYDITTDGFLEREPYRDERKEQEEKAEEMRRLERERKKEAEEERQRLENEQKEAEEKQRLENEQRERLAQEQREAEERRRLEQEQREAEERQRLEKEAEENQRLGKKQQLEEQRRLEAEVNGRAATEDQLANAIHEKMTTHASLMNANELMSDYNWKVKGSTVATEKKLLGQLHSLDNTNLQSIIQSEEHIKSIVGHIDRSLEELDNMENWLSRYATQGNKNDSMLEKA